MLIRKIIGNPAEDYTRESMAQMPGVNIRTLTKSFQDTVSCSPMQFVIQARMNLAKQLLETDSMPFYQVAATCGYRSLAFFPENSKSIAAVPRANMSNGWNDNLNGIKRLSPKHKPGIHQ